MEPTQPTPPSKMRVAYDYLRAKDVAVPEDFDAFATGMRDDPAKLQTLYNYFKEHDVAVPENYDEFTGALLADVKKKPGGVDAGPGSTSPSPSDSPGAVPSSLNPAQMQAAEGIDPADIDPAALVTAPAHPDQLAARGGLLRTPGDEYIEAGLPLPSGEQLRAEEEARQKAAAEAAAAQGDGFFTTLGKQLTNLPATLENAAGNVVDYLGDAVEPLTRVGTFATPYGVSYSTDGVGQGNRAPVSAQELNAPLRDDKPTDVAGASLRVDAASRTTQVSEAARQSVLDHPTNPAAWGNLLGQGVNSLAAIAAATAAGGPAAGITAGGALGISATKDAARDAGLSDKEAMLTATVLAPIQGVLEETGLGFITKNKALTGLLTRGIIGRAVASAGGTLSETALVRAASAILPEVVKRAGKAAAGEALTEFLQGEAEGLTQLAADKLRGNPEAPAGQGRYGVTPYDALVKSPVEQAIGGALLGGAAGSFHGETEATPTANVVNPSLSPDAIYYVTGDESATNEGALATARIVGPGQTPGTVHVEGSTFDGTVVQRDVAQERLLAHEPSPAEPIAEAAAPTVVEAALDAAPVAAESAPTPLENPVPSAAAPIDEPTPSTPTPESPAEPQPSPAETPAAPASPPDAASGPLPVAEPHPDHVKTLTPKQQKTNAALDALDRFNSLNKTEQKSADGRARRKELIKLAGKAGLTIKDLPSGKAAIDGARVTRSNEYTATTPAANHVPLDERPAAARPFIDAVLAGAETNPTEIQGLGIKMRGKELSGRELADAVKDIRAGRNTLRAQLVLDTLENAHRVGYLEKSTGTGLATQKFAVPIEAYTSEGPAATGTSRELSDAELDTIYDNDPKARAAVEDYAFSDGTIDYARLANDEAGLPLVFDVSDETATKIAQLARERAQQSNAIQRNPTQSNAIENQPDAGNTPEGDARVNESAPASQPTSEVAQKVQADQESAGGAGAPYTPALSLAEQNVAAKQEFADALAEFRAARKKGSGTLQSSVLGVPAFSAEEAAALTKMAKAAIKLGAVKTKQVIARLRAQGLTDDDATDDQLRPFVRQLLADEGVRQPKEPQRPLAPNEPDGSATRSSMARLDADPTAPEALKERVRDTGLDKYEPKSVAESEKAVDDYMQRNSLAEAYTEAIRTSDQLTGDVRTALRVRVLKALGSQLTSALDRGDTASADAYLDQAEKVTEALAKRGTDAGREINAYKLLVTQTPEAAVYKAQKEVAAQREQEVAKIGKKLPRERRKIEKAKAEALDHALATPAVRAVREQVAGKQPVTTRERRDAIRAERADLFQQLNKLTSALGITPQQQAIAELHVKIFRSYIQEGVLAVQALVERIKRDAGPKGLGSVTDQQLRQRAAAAKGDHNEAIRQGTATLGTTLDRIARDYVNDPAAIGKTLAEQFVAEAGLSPAEAKTYAQAIEAEFSKRVAQARQRRIDELNKRAQAQGTAQPRGSQSDLDKTRELFALSPTDDNAILEHLKRVNKLPQLTAQDVAHLRKLAQAVQDAKGNNAKAEAVFELMLAQKNIKGVTYYEAGKAFFYAHLLTGVFTHVKNFVSTGFNGAIQLMSETGYAGYLAAGHAIRTRDAGALALVSAPYRGIKRSFGSSVDQAYKVLATGVEPVDMDEKYGTPNDLEALRRKFPNSSNADIRALQLGRQQYAAFASYAGRFLKANDVLFQVNFTNMRAFNLAMAEAMSTGKTLPTKEIWGRINEILYNTSLRLDEAQAQAASEVPGAGVSKNPLALDNVRYRMRVRELMEQSRDKEIDAQAKAGAARDAFNGPLEGILGDATSKLQSFTDIEGPFGVQPIKTQIPFTKIIANQVNAGLDFTPLGLYRAAKGKIGYRGNSFERIYTGKERAEVAFRGAVGAALVLSIGSALLGHKRLSGAGPDDPERKRAMQAAGWQEFSYNFGTEENPNWWRYRDTALNPIFSAIANIREGEAYNGADYSKDPLQIKKMGALVFGAIQGVKSSTALQNLSDMLNSVGNVGDGTAEERFMRWAQRQVGTTMGTLLTPGGNLTNQVSKMAQKQLDVPKRSPKTVTEFATQNIDWGGAEPAYDDLGYPMRIDNDVFQSGAPDWHDDTEKNIRAFQAKYGRFKIVYVPDAQRMNTDMMVLRMNPTAQPLTSAERARLVKMTQFEKKQFLKGRGDLEGPMGQKMFADFKLRRARKIREYYALSLNDLRREAEENPRILENRLRRIYKSATRQAKLEVLNGTGGSLPYGDTMDTSNQDE